METIEGTVESVIYYNPENGYCILRLMPPHHRFIREDQLITVVGNMPEFQPGETVRFEGDWTVHPTYGEQFKAHSFVQTRPATLEGIKRYLASGMVEGIGPVYAERIVEHFGIKTFEILDRDPERVKEVRGIGEKRGANIAKAWLEHQALRQIMAQLQSYGISAKMAIQIFNHYGDEAFEVVQREPYRLVHDIHGVGFKRADQIARSFGLPLQAPARIEAGIVHVLNEAEADGHIYLPSEELIRKASELLQLEPLTIEQMLQELSDSEAIQIEDIPTADGTGWQQVVYRKMMFHSEQGVARRIQFMVDAEESRLAHLQEMDTHQWEQMIRRLLAIDDVELSQQQREAVRATLTNKVCVLTGGPGTGKTTTLRTVIAVLEAEGCTFALASPTGRAAKRLAEATGQPAQTIHRLLMYSPNDGYGYNEDYPLDVDMVIIDEASMLDLLLFYSLLKAIDVGTHLLLVGDVDQLPSVGAGDVLRDIIKSGVCPVFQLDRVFRQADDSMIIENAHRINHGKLPDTANKSQDFFFFGAEDPQEAAELLIDIVTYRIPQKFGFDPKQDIQVLSPMYKGHVGVDALNQALQKALNPSGGRKAEIRVGRTQFRVGDKVMQTRNNYDKEVYNGDIGLIHSIDLTDEMLFVEFDGRIVEYEKSVLEELVHAFAISVHKSQGAEYPVIVMPILPQHYMMLQRNLLYTAITRAKQMVVLVGTRKAIAIAVNNNRVSKRYSALAWRLMI